MPPTKTAASPVTTARPASSLLAERVTAQVFQALLATWCLGIDLQELLPGFVGALPILPRFRDHGKRLQCGKAARLALQPANAPAPLPRPGTQATLAVEVDGVAFPDLAQAYGWRPVGVRRDELDGRPATIVDYRKDARRLAYAIVSGDGLAPPGGAARTTRGGVEYRTLTVDGRPAVTWRRDGHTCVLIGDATPSELVTLASWLA